MAATIRSCIFILCFWGLHVHAQNILAGEKFRISGKVTDSLSTSPIYYATVAVLPENSTVPVNGAVTDEKGAFMITGLSAGTYKVSITFIGYATKSIPNVRLNAKTPSVKFDNIQLAPSSNQLKDVVIAGQKSMVEYKSDKIVYNAENDLTSQGGVATDVLKKVPQVSVDVDGNVELQGNSSILFLINGKPSSMFGNNLAEALKTIPANQIKSIEVITNPGAKYDGKGTGGIINIILKDNRLQGVSGSVNASIGTRLENGSFNLNIRNGKVGIHMFLSGNGQVNSTTLTTSSQRAYDLSTNTTTLLTQNGSSNYKRYGSIMGLGLDWEASKHDNLTLNIGANLGGNFNKGPFQQESTVTDDKGTILSVSNPVRNTLTSFNFYSFDWSLGYTHQFKTEGQELSFLYSSSYGLNNNYYQQSQTYAAQVNPFQGSMSKNPGSDWETNIQADYSQPASKHLVFETGAKVEIEQFNARTSSYSLAPANGEYNSNAAQSYAIKFDRNVYAGYLSGDLTLAEHLHLRAGLRYERTTNNGYFSNAANVGIAPYNTWLPSGNASYDFKGSQSLRLGYSHRIERPEYRELNPFVNSADPHNLVTGNPSLMPEVSDKVELAYKKSFEKYVSFNVSLFYQKNSHDIKQPVTYYPYYTLGDSVYANVSLAEYANIGSEQKAGFSGYVSLQTPFKLSVTSNVMVYERYIQSSLISGNATGGVEYRINGNITYQFPKEVLFEFFINYNSSRTGLQGKYPSFLSYSFAFRKLFLHDKLSLALTCTNFFDEYVTQKTTLSSQQFDLATTRKVPYRSFGITVAYKFGKLGVKKGKKEEDPGNSNNPFE